MNDPAYARLLKLTSLPTAAGREGKPIAAVRQWATARPDLRLQADNFGNLYIQPVTAGQSPPIIIEAHLDHPAFIIEAVQGRSLQAAFRGGVRDAYFPNTTIAWHDAHDRAHTGRVQDIIEPAGQKSRDQRVRILMDEPVPAKPGDPLVWNLPAARAEAGRLHAPACDDLAGVAAAIDAYDAWLDQRDPEHAADVRLLFTRAEEVGLIGAAAACRTAMIPDNARIIALENSKSFAESPIGGGPILRVGDRLSSFDPDLTYRLGQLAQTLAERDETFQWQRRLMPGGACEASIFQAMGYTTACLCLPLGNYHNMNEDTGRIDSEIISLDDYTRLVRWLVHVAHHLNEHEHAPTLRHHLDERFEAGRAILEETP